MTAPTSTETLQLRLEKPDWFVPVPLGSRHYVAAVQTKPGELDALRYAPIEIWERMTPLLQIVGPKKETEPFRAGRVSGWMKKIAAVVGSRPCFLDILRLLPTHRTVTKAGSREPVLSAIYAAARRRGMLLFRSCPWAASTRKAM